MGTASFKSISPVSTPASICMMVTPVSVSPFKIAHSMGAAPRYFGSREAWMFRQPYRGRSRISWDRI